MQTLDCAWLLADPGTEAARAHMRIAIEDGRIAALAPIDAAALASAPSPDKASGSRRLVLPALSNAHDHARTFRSATLGSHDQPLEGWLPFQGVLPGMDPYLCAATSFARSLRHGVVDLMAHYTRVQGGMAYVQEAEALCRAARDVGVRVGFAIAMRDRNGLGYGEDAQVLRALRPGIRDAVAGRLSVKAPAPAAQLAQVDEVAQMVEEGGYAGHVTVQYGPTAVQWCSTPLLEAIARASADSGRPVHMHCLETRYQRQWADEQHPEGIVRFLDDIGLLGPRLTLAHCTWARPDELALIAERGATIAVNTSSNLGLRSGIAPVPEMLRQGCRIAMGLDGGAFDDDDDALREMRLAYALHRGWGFDATMTRRQLWAFAARHGQRVVRGGAAAGEGGGRIAIGEAANLIVLDWEAIDDDGIFPDVDPLDLLLARAKGAHIAQVYAGGRRVVDQGRVEGIDEPALRAELLGRMRSALQSDDVPAAWLATARAMAKDLAPFYREGRFGCCG